MLDFFTITTEMKRTGTEIFPKFIIKKSKDLMIRGGDFYAVWIEEAGLWSTDEQDVIRIVDRELERYKNEHFAELGGVVKVKYMWDASSGVIDDWHKYCQKQSRDSYHMLDETLIFSNSETNKKDYATKRLPYPLEEGPTPAYDRLISTLYSEEERHKIEWAIGAIVTGDSKTIQKFMVLYGAAGTGKSTILNVIQQLFEGYYCVFDAKSLGSNGSQFALEAFRNNPLVAIQHDGDLSKIEDNTRINSLTSHEEMMVNEKYTKGYTNRFKCFLFMGTNRPVRITDGKSGLLRRLIDVTPSGNKLDPKEYKTIMKQIPFELGGIASHCQDVYLDNPGAYDDYLPSGMMGASNDFYNFVIDAYSVFKKEDGTTLKAAWEMYKVYCDEARVPYPMSQRNFKEELKNYFWDFEEQFITEDGSKGKSRYTGFRIDIFEKDMQPKKKRVTNPKTNTIDFQEQESIFDKECADCPAQYGSSKETPGSKWESVKTVLGQLDTGKLHYVQVPENHIVIDFDIKDENGNKSFERNVEEASKWPPTYAELSKSGAGVHLHYIYNGDVSRLSRVYADDIEVKVFTGKSSLRRKLTKCNNLPIATISSGLPLKGEEKVLNTEVIRSERGLRTTLVQCLNKQHHGATKPEVDFMFKILQDAYDSGMKYDVSDLKNAVIGFAANSTNQAETCMALVDKMKFKSDEPSDAVDNDDKPLVFYDVEVFPNLFLVNWKIEGEEKPVVRMINPKPSDIEDLLKLRLVGFNCRRYDNHMLYARLMGYTNEQLYNLSQKIVTAKKGDKVNCFFSEAYNISYTDVYDFAATKQSLKKWEIELGIHHQELGLPWDQPVPEEMWTKVAEYCDNDVIATEAVFNHLKADFLARQILSDMAGGTSSVNDTTNTLTTRIIFGNNKKPQGEFYYRDMAKPVFEIDREIREFLTEIMPEMMSVRHGAAGSILPYFDGYKYSYGKSSYRDVDNVGEGGRVYAKQGMFSMVALLDVASMHPHSAMAECHFGPRYTRAFRDIVEGRVNIKHKAWDIVNEMLDGKLRPYVQKVLDGELTSKDLAYALKIAINSVYGLTAASFDNPFHDPRNIDNIVAKRGALFMIDLQHAVEERGFTVAHIKTDSIKIPNATPEIIKFVMDFGKRYGYTFEHEATYEKMCLVNDAVYVAKYAKPADCEALYGYIPADNAEHGGEWTATGTQFQVPYVFKKLFSREPIEFSDMCETKEVKSSLYLDMNEDLPDVTVLEKEWDKAETDYKKGKLSDITFEATCDRLRDPIAEGHNYIFVGRIGNFCPVVEGAGGGVLVREQNNKYYAATGTKGYRWLESEAVKLLGKEDLIDRSYYDALVDAAVETIGQYGDFEWFVSDDPLPRDIDLPWALPCGDMSKKSCFNCPHFNNDPYHMDCGKGHDISGIILNKFNDFAPDESLEVPFK